MKTIAGIILTFLLGAMFVSLFHMSAGMDMEHGMSDCPFMTHEEVICPMDFFDHILAWQSAFLSTPPESALVTLLVTSVFVIFFATDFPRKICKISHLLPHRFRERTYCYVLRALQELFARGILNPKVH